MVARCTDVVSSIFLFVCLLLDTGLNADDFEYFLCGHGVM